MSSVSWSDIVDGCGCDFDDSPNSPITYTFSFPEPEDDFTMSGITNAENLFNDCTVINPPGEFESRTVIASNLTDQLFLDDRFPRYVEITFGSLNDVAFFERERCVILTFFDLRHARMMRWSELRYRDFPIQVNFYTFPPASDQRGPPNNGTLALFNLKNDINDGDIVRELGKYGRIRQIRQNPQKKTQRFVEYWDTRDSEAALEAINGKYLFGSRISAEFSLPGGLKKCVEPVRPKIERKATSPALLISIGRRA
jgi:hypothetical protein